MITSTRHAERLLGVSHVTFAKWMDRDDWPYGKLPISTDLVPAIKAWAANTLRPANVEGNAVEQDTKKLSLKTQVDINHKVAQTRLTKFNLALLEKKYHRVDDCRARSVQQLAALKSLFRSLPAALPFQSDVKTLVQGRIDEALRSIQQMTDSAQAYVDLCKADLAAALEQCDKFWAKRPALDAASVGADVTAAFEEAVKKRCA